MNNAKSQILFFFSLFVNLALYSQKDNEFWFAAPAITKDHSAEIGATCLGTNKMGAAPVSLNFINSNDIDAIVTIEQPANTYDDVTNPTGFVPIVITVPANSFYRQELWGNDLCDPNNQSMRENVETRIDPLNPQTILNTGLRIFSTELITAYYEVEEQNNSETFVLKGANALGDDFFIPFQTIANNYYFANQRAHSAIDIVAVDGGTTRVWVYPTNEIIGWGSVPFFIDLQQGQSISLVPGIDNGGGNYTYNLAPADRLAGTHIVVEGGKRVAVTSTDDSVRGATGCYDILGDQIIPVKALDIDGTTKTLIGIEYIVVKGELGYNKSGSDYDNIYILATEDNTDVIIEDVTGGGGEDLMISNMMSQEQETYTIATEDNSITYAVHIIATKPVYVFHVTGAGGGCEFGGAILPPISNCSGSYDVGFSRGSESNKDFLANILVREENDTDSARYAFTFNGTLRPDLGDGFIKIAGTNWWAGQFDFDVEVSQYSSNIISNSKNIFHLGALNGGSSNGGNYGYFSEFSSSNGMAYISGTADSGAKICYGDTIQIAAYGGLEYEWLEYDVLTAEYTPARYLSDNNAQKPFASPKTSTKYNVVISGSSCALPDTVELEIIVADSLSADFEVDIAEGCAPLNLDVNNTSYGNEKNYWYIDNEIKSLDAEPDEFLFANHTDTAIDFNLKLVTKNTYCEKEIEKTIRVYPEVKAEFNVSDSIGCTPLDVEFENLSTGENLSYSWDFGDQYFTDQTDPPHTFTNDTDTSVIYQVQTLVTSPFNCIDTSKIDIYVLPKPKTNLPDTVSSGRLDTLKLAASYNPDYEYLWQPGDITDSVYDISTEGTYYLTTSIPELKGCTTEDSVFVKHLTTDISVDSMLSPISSCMSDSVIFVNVRLKNTGTDTINAEDTIFITLEIEELSIILYDTLLIKEKLYPNGNIDVQIDNSVINFTSEHFTYHFKIFSHFIRDNNHTNNTLTAIRHLYLNPTVDIKDEWGQPIEDETVFITTANLNAGEGFELYEWSMGNTEQTITINETGLYSVTVTDENGCSGSDTVSLIKNQQDIGITAINYPRNSCAPDSAFNVQALLTNIGNDTIYTNNSSISVNYKFNNEMVVTESLILENNFAPGDSILYTFKKNKFVENPINDSVEINLKSFISFLDDINNSNDTVFTTSYFYKNPTIDLGKDKIIRDNAPYLIRLEECEQCSYTWSTGSDSSSTAIWYTGNYSATLFNSKGCAATDNISITFLSPSIQTIEIAQPEDLCSFGEKDITIGISNIGLDTFSIWNNIDAYYILNNGDIISEQFAVAEEFWPNDTLWYTFNQKVDISSPGSYAIKAFAKLDYETEPFGDTIIKVFDFHPLPEINFSHNAIADTIFTELPFSLEVDTTGLTSYLWSTNSKSFKIEIDKNGWYGITAFNLNDCSISDSIYIYDENYICDTCSSSTFKKSLNIELQLEVFPNPVNNVLNIDLNANKKGSVILQLFNSHGACILSRKFEIENKSTEAIDMEYLPSGIYYIQVIFDNKKMNYSIIKQ